MKRTLCRGGCGMRRADASIKRATSRRTVSATKHNMGGSVRAAKWSMNGRLLCRSLVKSIKLHGTGRSHIGPSCDIHTKRLLASTSFSIQAYGRPRPDRDVQVMRTYDVGCTLAPGPEALRCAGSVRIS